MLPARRKPLPLHRTLSKHHLIESQLIRTIQAFNHLANERLHISAQPEHHKPGTRRKTPNFLSDWRERARLESQGE